MPATDKYTGVAIGLHWLIALLILGQIAGGIYMADLANSASKFELYQQHKSFGITILILSLFRLAWRFTHAVPPLPEGMKNWERLAARGTHIAFYILMIGIPIGGWALVSASPFADSVPTYVFGIVPWPHMPFFGGVADREALAASLAGLHKTGAFATMGLLVLHIAAALKHHFVNKDTVLARMSPFVARKK